MQIENNVLIRIEPHDIIDGLFIVPEGITSIGKRAFWDCSSLTSIILPEGITSIGNETFRHCSSLTSIILPASITSIGEGAFWDCRSLTNIILPESITSIGKCAFGGCRSLTSIILPESITSIGESAFCGCRSLTSINLPASITSIGKNAFTACRSLTSINLPKDIASIGEYAFSCCENLININLPKSITSIGEGAFSFCSSLTSINLPEGIVSIGKGAFFNCRSLTSINIITSAPEEFERIRALLPVDLRQRSDIITKGMMLLLDNNQLHKAVKYFIDTPKPSNEMAFALASALLASSDNTKEAHQSILDLFNEYDDDTDIRMLLERSVLSTLSLLSKEQPAALSDSLADYTIDRCLPCSSILKTINEIQDFDEELRKQLNEAESLLPMLTAIEIYQLISTVALKDAFLKKYGTSNIVTYESIVLLASKQEVDTFCQRKDSSPRTNLDRELITNMLNDAAVRAHVSESTHQPATATNSLGDFGLFPNAATGMNVNNEITHALPGAPSISRRTGWGHH